MTPEDTLRVLLVEDSDSDAALVMRELRRGGGSVQFVRVQQAAEMRTALALGGCDAIICDWSLPSFGAQAALEILKEAGLDLPFIIISGAIGEESAVVALKSGAHDFVFKGNLARLRPALDRELVEARLRRAHRRALQELLASQVRYRQLFENNPQPMWVHDPKTRAFVAVNDAALEHYGYSRDEFARMVVTDIVASDDLPAAETRPSPVVGPQLWRHRKKDGTIIRVEVKAQTFELDGEPARLVLLNDVTDRLRAEEELKKAEAQLRQAQKMEAIGGLAGGIAHDFNNMLSIILSYSDLVLAELGPQDSLRGDIEEIRRAGARAAEMTRQLLAFSRKQVLEPRIIDLNRLLAGMENMLRRLLGASLQLSMPTSLRVGKVYADPGQIEQIVVNLAINARDAMPNGGRLVLETSDVEVGAASAPELVGVAPGRYVLLRVTDTGTGMDPATQARIFEPFFTTKEPGKGTGLGLASVFGIVQQSGGHIRVQSELGRGSTFSVLLPRRDGPEEETSADPDEPTNLRGTETVLLVEDEDQVRTLIQTILRRSGYNVLEAQNGGEAFLISEQHAGPIHLLVTDIVMPRMSGGRIAERLSALRPAMKILYISGYVGGSFESDSLLDSGAGFLQKPVTPQALLRKVRELLDSPPAHPASRRPRPVDDASP